MDTTGDNDSYCLSDDKTYLRDPTRPHAYFCALLKAEEIFDRLPMVNGVLMGIHHKLQESYYQVLLHCRDHAKLVKLIEMIDKPRERAIVGGDDFKALLNDVNVPRAEAMEEGEDSERHALGDQPDVAIDVDAQDRQSIHRISVQFIRNLPADQVDLRETYQVAGCTVRLDNCSHSSGKQRAWVKCDSAHHHRCFRYCRVDDFESNEAAAAF